MKKRYKIPIIVVIVIFGIPLAWYLETLVSIEIRKQNYINVEKNSPPIEIIGVIDYEHAFDGTFVYLMPDPDEMYKIEGTGVNKAYLQYSFIDPGKGKIPSDFDGSRVQIKGVLVNDDPNYGKPEKTYDAIIIVHETKVLDYKVESKFVEEDVFVVPNSYYDKIFYFLTHNVWEDSGCLPTLSPFAPTCSKLEFKRSGEYSWFAASDYTERSEIGKWNFVLNSPNSGLLFFDNGSVLPFKKMDKELKFRYNNFSPSNEIDYSSEELKKDRNSLPEIIPSEIYFKLIQNPWKRTNDFNLNTSPEIIIFNDNGKFHASYRNNQCSHEGTWGVDGRTLISISYPNTCDLRGNSANIAASNEQPIIENDVLVFFQDSYYDLESKIEKKMFTFDRHGSSIKVKGEYSGGFKKNNPTTIDLTFENVSDIDKELGEFTIKLLTCGPPQPNTGCSDTKEDLIITKNYTGILLHSSEIHQDSVTIIPTTDGDNYIKFSLKFEDERQPYQANHGYVLNIE